MATTATSTSKTAKARTTSKSKSAGSTAKKGASSSRGQQAITLLKADHREVEKLFGQYEKAKEDDARKVQIFRQINLALKVHMQIEEEIFYPTSREFIEDDDTVNEAEVEHQSAKDLMGQLEGMDPADPYYDAKVKVLQEMIEHHVEEEEQEYFPECQESEMDLKAVGEQLKARKQELMAQMGGPASAH